MGMHLFKNQYLSPKQDYMERYKVGGGGEALTIIKEMAKYLGIRL